MNYADYYRPPTRPYSRQRSQAVPDYSGIPGPPQKPLYQPPKSSNGMAKGYYQPTDPYQPYQGYVGANPYQYGSPYQTYQSLRPPRTLEENSRPNAIYRQQDGTLGKMRPPYVPPYQALNTYGPGSWGGQQYQAPPSQFFPGSVGNNRNGTWMNY